ncbi:MAG: GntR family transcriptional regulator [Verrucomicrobia bacterium]|nr:GntR family transcriptional regulator [Verrucomicrobiota bacterium]MCH8527535.1 GntR family transcriptional regulator [Kiritimatiellia bacterium]
MPKAASKKKPNSPSTPTRKLNRKEQIKAHLLDLIKREIIRPGQLLPPIRTISEEFQTSMTPVVQAIRELSDMGLVEMVQGQGCRVRNLSISEDTVTSRPVVDVLCLSDKVNKQYAQSRIHTILGSQYGAIQHLGDSGRVKVSVTMLPKRISDENIDAQLRDLATLRPDGIVLTNVPKFSQQHFMRLKNLHNAGCTIVAAAGHQSFEEFDRVVPAFDEGQQQLTEHFLNQGKKHFLRLSFHPKHAWFENPKQEGYRNAMLGAGFSEEAVKQRTLHLYEEHERPEEIGQNLERLIGLLTLAFHKQEVEVIFAPNDALVADVRAALHFLGRKNIEVAGYDMMWQELEKELKECHPELDDLGPPPVSVDTHQLELGHTLAEFMIDRLKIPARERAELPPETRRIPQSLFVPPGEQV